MDPFKKEKRIALLKKIVFIIAMILIAYFLINFFSMSRYNIKNLAEIKSSLEKSINLSEENQKLIVNLENNKLKVKRGESFGIAFVIKNLGMEGNFSYSVTAKEGDCQNPEKIVTAGSGSTKLMENSTYFGLIIFEPVKDMSRCTEIFKLRVEKDGIEYEESILNVTIS